MRHVVHPAHPLHEIPRWDDLRFPAQGINPPGAGSDPSRNSTTGLLEFAGNADNIIVGVAQMPHAWVSGSIIRPHVHLVFETSAAGVNTRWKFEYNRADVNDAFENAIGTWTTLATITVANPEDTDLHVISSFGDLAMTGYAHSAIVHWKVSRLALSDGADDDTNACTLLEMDFHYMQDRLGTVKEY